MRRLCLLIACCLLVAGCARGPKGIWRASHTRGSDPAIAIELVRDGDKFSGAMFLLNADTPDDFTTGKSYPITVKSADDNEIRFAVEFLPYEPNNLILRLEKPVDGGTFHGVLVTVDGRGDPIDFKFTRVVTK